MANINGAKGFFGPYNSQQEGADNQGADLEKCKAGQVKVVSCKVEPWFKCPEGIPSLVGLGTPGTKEWCDAVDKVIKALGDLGNQLYAFINNMLDTNTIVKGMDDYYNSLPPLSPASPFVALLRFIYCQIGPLFETIRQAISCTKSWLTNVYPKCNVSGLFGLLTIRHFLLSLEKIEWGSDAGVWITAISGFYIDPFMTTLDYLIRYSCPIELMTEQEAIDGWKYNYIDDNLLRCILAAHGKQLDQMLPAINARGEKLSPKEAIQWSRRQGFGGDVEDALLRNLGFVDKSHADAFKYLYDELPTIGDHLEWMRKNVFDDAYVEHFKLMEGFEERFWSKFGGDLRALGMKKENAALHYAAHWVNPSFTQLFEMTQRLRPGKVDPSLVFTTQDLLRVMQEQDVGVYFRDKLEAISHPVINLSLLIQLYEFGKVDDTDFLHRLQDLGFDVPTATVILKGQVIKVRRRNAASGHGWTPASLANAYALGQITKEQVTNEMDFLGYSKEAADRLMKRAELDLAGSPVKRLMQSELRAAISTQKSAYECGVITRDQYVGVLQKAGISDRIAGISADNADATIEVALCKEQIKEFRQAVLRGKVTLDEAATLLGLINVPALRIKQLTDTWRVELRTRSPVASAAQILRWLSTGLIDLSVARSRLLNLGWTDPDLTLSLVESAGKLSRLQARQLATAALSEQKAAKSALQVSKEAQSLARKSIATLRGQASMSTLKRWYKEKLIEDVEFLDFAIARGYPPKVADKYLAEARFAREAFAALAEKRLARRPAIEPGEPSIAKTTTMYAEGILTESQFRQELSERGVAQEDADRYWSLAVLAREKADAAALKAGKTPPSEIAGGRSGPGPS